MFSRLQKFSTSSIVLLGVAIVLVAGTGFLFASDVLDVRKGGGFAPGHERGKPATPADVERTRAWMTFDLINARFKLPPTYLSETLQITDTRYPRISIADAAAAEGVATDLFLQQVKDALLRSLEPQP